MSYTADVCTGGTGFATRWYASTYDYTKAFDNNDASYWDGYPWVSGDVIGYDLGSGVTKVAAQYTIHIFSTIYPTAWKFQGSNDNTNWTDIDTQTGQTFSTSEKRTFNSFSNSTGYRYYRWQINTISSGNEPSISEFEIMELVEDITGTTSDSANVSDSFDSLIDGSSEGVTVSDNFSVGYQYSSDIADNVTVSDDFEASIFVPSLDALIDVSDEFSAGFLLDGGISDDIIVSDNFVLERTFLETVTETLDFSDFCAKILGCTISDTIFVYDESKVGWSLNAESLLTCTDSINTVLGILVDEWLTITETIADNWDGQEVINESITLYDTLVAIKAFSDTLTDTMDISDSSLFQLIVTILDVLGFEDLASAVRSSAVSISESVTLADTPDLSLPVSATSELDFVDTSSIFASFIHILQSNLDLTDAPSLIARLTGSVTESISFAETIISKGTYYNLIYDTIAMNVSISLNNEIWECYALNTPKFQPSMYSGFDFNSFCIFDDRAFGANATGIFELTGDTDAGSEIHTGVIFSRTDFDLFNQKKFRKGYLDISGTTPKIILETDRGQRQVYDIDTTGKVTISSELKSRIWELSIADFDSLESMTLIPIILTR